MPRRVVIDPSGSPRQVPPRATSPDAPRRRRRAESSQDGGYASPTSRQPSRRDPLNRTEARPADYREPRGEVPIREVPRREAPRREVPRRESSGRRSATGGTPAEELIRRATASREAAARQIAARRAAEQQSGTGQRGAGPEPTGTGRRSIGRHTTDAIPTAQPDGGRSREVPRRDSAGREVYGRDTSRRNGVGRDMTGPAGDSGEAPTRAIPRRPATETGQHALLDHATPLSGPPTRADAGHTGTSHTRTSHAETRRDDAGREDTTRAADRRTSDHSTTDRAGTGHSATSDHNTTSDQSTTSDHSATDRDTGTRASGGRAASRRERTWRDGPRENATWRDASRREVPRRRSGAQKAASATVVIETAGSAGVQAEAAATDAPSSTVLDLDSARRSSPRRRAERRSATEHGTGETTATRALAALGRVTRRREPSHRDSAHRDSSHREARNRPATSRELSQIRDTGPRRHRRIGRKRIGAGLLAMLTVAAGITAAAGYAISRPDTATPIASTAASATPCNQTGPGQRDVEAYLVTRSGQYGRVKADGRQSPSDCAAIASFQRWAQVPTQTGFADATTGFLARQLASIRYDQCQAPGDRMTVCVDLANQAMWVVQSGRIVLGPTAARSGRPGQATPTGRYTITQKKVKTVSSEYGTPLPYWERFVDDIGFHTADTPMYSAIPGSFGCVNLLDRDAKALYAMTEIGTAVNVFGEKPGT